MAIETAPLGACAAWRAIGAPRLARAAVTPRHRVARPPAQSVTPKSFADPRAVHDGQKPHNVVHAQRLRWRHVGAGQKVTGPQTLKPTFSTVAADSFLGDGGLAAAYAPLLKLELRQRLGHRGPSQREQSYHSKDGIGRGSGPYPQDSSGRGTRIVTAFVRRVGPTGRTADRGHAHCRSARFTEVGPGER